jgi:hypothetical protein
MLSKHFFRNILLLLLLVAFLSNCKKQDDFLDEKTNIALTVPTTVSDFQNLLNNEQVFNTNDPALGALTGEDFTVSNAIWVAAPSSSRNTYIFAPTIYDISSNYGDWSQPYNAIYIANTVLDAADNLVKTGAKTDDVNHLRGQALFYRSWNLYTLVQTYAMPYDSVTAVTDLGIPLRLSSDFNVKADRASVENCYAQIILDLKNCLTLLPATSIYKTRPNQTAANALLARVYVGMGKYPLAFSYADAALSQVSSLLDFNNINATAYPLTGNSFPAEDIFHNVLHNYNFLMHDRGSAVDSALFLLYDSNDLRKSRYFETGRNSGYLTFKGSYDFSGYTYSGLATDELYLIRAECYARAGNTTDAMNDLNTLLIKRWKTGTFTPFTASSADEAVIKILQERRKELVWRGLRWTDLRRLNKENRFKTTLTHLMNGNVYTLAPNSTLYAMPIPDPEIQLSGIAQNKRQ